MVSRFPAAFQPPAFASWPSCSRRGVGRPSRSAYRTLVRTPTGFPRSARTSSDRVGCPLYPGDDGALRTGRPDRPAPAASQRRVPAPRVQHPIREAPLHEASTKVQAIHPSGLPLTRRRPDGTSSRFGFSSSFAPRRYQRRTSRMGTGHRARTWITLTTSAEPPIQRNHS
jgi:hypothetical protein